MKKTYILLKNTDYAPTGPFQLGSLLADPAAPESIIENSSPVPLPAIILLQKSSLRDFKGSHEKNQSGKYGIFSKFLYVLGIRAWLQLFLVVYLAWNSKLYILLKVEDFPWLWTIAIMVDNNTSEFEVVREFEKHSLSY
ncbi:hypothetical protein N431DRAFT_452585 [Stipitochalara longipes BDJ]|nr:hypothetical protein N431DRAFT_452585 [Stipitochalara longipes BDJ]